MKKAKKVILIIIAVILGAALIAACIFLYMHGNTKPYTVPEEVHKAIEAQKVEKGSDEVRIMSSNLLVYYPSWHGEGSRSVRLTDARPRAKIYMDILETYKPDVIGLQEVCDMWYNCLLRNKMNYKFVQSAKTAFTVRMTNLMYNTDTTELIESGDFKYSKGNNPRLRCIVWGLFKDKATGSKYIVTSTHFDFITEDRKTSLEVMQTQTEELFEQSELLKNKYNVPVYHTGDYNSVNNIENWEELFPEKSEEQMAEIRKNAESVKEEQAPSIYTDIEATLTDAKLAAKDFSAAGTTTVKSPAYDHIFINGNTPVSRYVTISDPVMLKLSDHYSVFIDAKIA